MNGEQIQQLAKSIAAKLPASELCTPFGSGTDVYKVMDKMFLLSTEVYGQKLLNLKVDPHRSEMLRDFYPSITSGYHMNKRHWISIYAGEDIHPDLIKDLVYDSYHLVASKLNKKQQNVLKIIAQLPK
nr:MmcQ/YjbR family DNA-binding protein [Acinetobacter sp. Marseille-Q1620]